MKQNRTQFKRTIWNFYNTNGRHDLPWRKTTDPYKILVSEVMLQQTQVDRVIPKYRKFLVQFPTVRALSSAGLGDVLRVWQGLGYNRRAKLLHECAKVLVEEYGGNVPRTSDVLGTLPGVGPYTAGAIMAFAYNKPVSLIETNIRTVYLHHFFDDQTNVNDRAILQSIGVTLDEEHPREWFWALMDYGAHLKKTIGNQNHRGRTYAKQSRFRGSDREIRGAILRALGARSASGASLYRTLTFEHERIKTQLKRLNAEGLVLLRGRTYSLPD